MSQLITTFTPWLPLQISADNRPNNDRISRRNLKSRHHSFSLLIARNLYMKIRKDFIFYKIKKKFNNIIKYTHFEDGLEDEEGVSVPLDASDAENR